MEDGECGGELYRVLNGGEGGGDPSILGLMGVMIIFLRQRLSGIFSSVYKTDFCDILLA